MHRIIQTEERKDPYVSESSDWWIRNSKKETHYRRTNSSLSGSFLQDIAGSVQWEWILCELSELYTDTCIPQGAKTRTAWLGTRWGNTLLLSTSQPLQVNLACHSIYKHESQPITFFCEDVSFWENRYKCALALHVFRGSLWSVGLIENLWIIKIVLEKYWDKTKTCITGCMCCPPSLKTWIHTFIKSAVQPRHSPQIVFLDKPLFLQQNWLCTEKISGKAQAS